MPSYVYFAHFFGGVFLANAFPHFNAGVSGQTFPTPFASPPFRGMSPPPVNIAWALVNLALAYLTLVRVEVLDLRSWSDFGIFFVGFGLWGLQCARAMVRIRKTTAS